MPTQEERISMLEQSVTMLNRGIWDIYHNETILLGMAIKQDENMRQLQSSLATLSEHLDTFEQSVNERFEALDGRIGALDGRIGALEQSVNRRFEEQDKKFDQILLLLNTLIPKSD